VQADHLTGITDGFDNTTTISYAPLSGANYTKLGSASFPMQEYAGPLQVVTNLQTSDGLGGAYQLQSFYYEGARRDLQGRGFLGFAFRAWVDSRDGTAQRRTYRQDYPVVGAVSNARRTQEPSGVAITEEQATYASFSYGSGYETRVFPYADQSTQLRSLVGGAYGGSLLRTVTTTNTYDSATGTLYDQTVTTTEPTSGANGVSAGQTWTQRTYSPLASLSNDTVSWCLGRPGEIQQTRSHTGYGGSSQTRTQQLTWNTTRCRPTQTVLQPGDPQWEVKTELAYDDDSGNAQPDFGNLTGTQVTGIGMAARTTSVNWGSTGQFPVSVTNALSQTTQKGYDYALCVQTSETDPNGVQVSWQYDAFGRQEPREPPRRHLLDLHAVPVHRVVRRLLHLGQRCLSGRPASLRQRRHADQLGGDLSRSARSHGGSGHAQPRRLPGQ